MAALDMNAAPNPLPPLTTLPPPPRAPLPPPHPPGMAALDMNAAEDRIVGNTREVVPGMVLAGEGAHAQGGGGARGPRFQPYRRRPQPPIACPQPQPPPHPTPTPHPPHPTPPPTPHPKT
jgi:hypothetical protein